MQSGNMSELITWKNKEQMSDSYSCMPPSVCFLRSMGLNKTSEVHSVSLLPKGQHDGEAAASSVPVSIDRNSCLWCNTFLPQFTPPQIHCTYTKLHLWLSLSLQRRAGLCKKHNRKTNVPPCFWMLHVSVFSGTAQQLNQSFTSVSSAEILIRMCNAV